MISGFRIPAAVSFRRMNNTIKTGTRVTARSDENPTARVFVQASGRNIRPSCASKRNTGRKETTMIRREKKRAGPTCFAASKQDAAAVTFSNRLGRLVFGKVSVAVFDHDDCRVHQNANRQGQSTE